MHLIYTGFEIEKLSWWDRVVCTVESPAVRFSLTLCEHRGELILSGQTRNLLHWCYHSCPIERHLKHCGVCVCVCANIKGVNFILDI